MCFPFLSVLLSFPSVVWWELAGCGWVGIITSSGARGEGGLRQFALTFALVLLVWEVGTATRSTIQVLYTSQREAIPFVHSGVNSAETR